MRSFATKNVQNLDNKVQKIFGLLCTRIGNFKNILRTDFMGSNLSLAK